MTSIDHLLPTPDESVRCTEYRRRLDLKPGGTAIRADRVVLVKTPLPWPKPVFDHHVLSTISPIIKAASVPTRLLAYAPPADSSDDLLGTHTASVVTFDRTTGSEVLERRYQADNQAALLSLAEALANDDKEILQALAGHEEQVHTPVVLVCTQGSHDVCCGSEGARFAAEVEASADDLVVYRVSHTGGHRFAPTAMTLPGGRMWADLDMELLRQVLSKTADAADVLDRCRGWWGADTGPAQIAELAAFGELGWELEDQARTVQVSGDEGFDNYNCVVATDRQALMITVSPRRTVPTIACRQPGGLPAKKATEYRVDHIRSLIAGAQ